MINVQTLLQVLDNFLIVARKKIIEILVPLKFEMQGKLFGHRITLFQNI